MKWKRYSYNKIIRTFHGANFVVVFDGAEGSVFFRKLGEGLVVEFFVFS
jgi:hypothetical protein